MGNFPLNASQNFGSTNQDYRANDTLFTEGADYDDRQRLSSQESNGNQDSQRQYKITNKKNFATQSVFSALTAHIESPLMRKSGFDLRQRLGRGDRTIDQILPINDN